jgi:carbamate kinase
MSPSSALQNRIACHAQRAKSQNGTEGQGTMGKLAVYALGGNALESPSSPDASSAEVLARVMSDIIDLLEMDWRVVLTHGNGPQVGHLLAMDKDHSQGLDAWVAATQGMIGQQLANQLHAILNRRRRPERTAVVLTRVEVDSSDDAFAWPTKPVGPVLDASTVMSADWDIAQTVHGARRVVASPLPVRVVDLDVIRQLVQLQAVVICGGGGGIPVVAVEQALQGVPAVIDKDAFSSLLARDLGADALIISTEADAIYRGFGTTQATALTNLTVAEAERMDEEGEFPKGSMGPKVKALCDFARASEDGVAVLCSPGDVLDSLRGVSGTLVSQ